MNWYCVIKNRRWSCPPYIINKTTTHHFGFVRPNFDLYYCPGGEIDESQCLATRNLLASAKDAAQKHLEESGTCSQHGEVVMPKRCMDCHYCIGCDYDRGTASCRDLLARTTVA
jgi:hypothetical protein